MEWSVFHYHCSILCEISCLVNGAISSISWDVYQSTISAQPCQCTLVSLRPETPKSLFFFLKPQPFNPNVKALCLLHQWLCSGLSWSLVFLHSSLLSFLLFVFLSPRLGWHSPIHQEIHGFLLPFDIAGNEFCLWLFHHAPFEPGVVLTLCSLVGIPVSVWILLFFLSVVHIHEFDCEIMCVWRFLYIYTPECFPNGSASGDCHTNHGSLRAWRLLRATNWLAHNMA